MKAIALGWDIHRKFSQVSVYRARDDGEIRIMERKRLEHEEREQMRQWLEPLTGTPVAMEATFGWPWVADLLQELGLEPHLAHPPAVRVLAKHEAKADRCDSDRLGRFYVQGILPESYLAPPEVRQLRERLRYRMALVAVRTGMKNRVHATLHRLGILHPFSDLFGEKGREFLQATALPEASRTVLTGWLNLLDQVTGEIDRVEEWMHRHLQTDPLVQLLETIPGIGLVLAHVIQAEIGQIERFPDYRRLTSYAGLAPLSNDSADRHGRRHCSPACNHTLRWAFIEAAGSAVRSRHSEGTHLRRLYQRLSRNQKLKNTAKVAVARELVKLVYIVWKKKRPYFADPPARPGQARAAQLQEPPSTSLRSDQPRHPMVRRGPKAAARPISN